MPDLSPEDLDNLVASIDRKLTDAQVDRALDVFYDGEPWRTYEFPEKWRAEMRAAIEAALQEGD